MTEAPAAIDGEKVEHDDADERRQRVERMMRALRDAERRRLAKRGIEVWNGTERAPTPGALSG